MVRATLLAAMLGLLIGVTRAQAEDDPWVTCRPAYCSAQFTTLLSHTDNIDRNGSFTDAPFAQQVIELRADVIPLAEKTYANLSVLALLDDRLDDPGNNLGILIPQAELYHKRWGLRWSVSYAPVFIFRNLFADNTARLHEINFGIKKSWKPETLFDSVDLRFELKERIAQPKAESEHRLTLEAEMVRRFDLFGQPMRLWIEARAETGLRNTERAGTRIGHKFTNTAELTTDLNRHVRLIVLKVRRTDQAAGPRTSDYARWDIGAGIKLKLTW